ncbi:hypothetical protein EC9_19350 [Rosistilla ulvae]|uniref:Ubiquinone biosynthesis O-methyltransferase n=1 Tax=Rosistilla ulvae TaxID=1930277 RepID=A0A517LYQ9_9BACT|nr:class I SAM-dependent methyltransferase [Rosistilla ulvae]QDS87754.1 hypothetical protein EC9_19350 [Rosistilla ulvae]
MISNCRACGSSHLEPVLSLGKTPLANRLLTADQLTEPEPTFPLELVFCADCTLVQITETVPPEELFSEYAYFSSYSDTMLEHAQNLVEHLVPTLQLTEDSLAVEIASNDGYLLQYYQQLGVPVLGIEPAQNIAAVAQERGIQTVADFFSLELATQLTEQGQSADVIHGHNVMAHVPELNGFVAGVHRILKPTGHAVFEVPYVKDLVDQVEFDTIYHEHLCYFSLTTLDRLFRSHGLTIVEASRVPIHGGSLRIVACRSEHCDQPGESVRTLLAEESAWGVDKLSFYLGLRNTVEGLRQDLLELLQDLKSEGMRIAAYGASAKGSTLLNYFGLGKEVLEYVVDRSPVKQGRYTPGTHLKIYEPEMLVADQPDYVLLLTWNFCDEILQQQVDYQDRGGKFIVPIPQVRIA